MLLNHLTNLAQASWLISELSNAIEVKNDKALQLLYRLGLPFCKFLVMNANFVYSAENSWVCSPLYYRICLRDTCESIP